MTETAETEAAGALLLIRKRIQGTADPVDLAGYIAQVGEFVLERLGFEMIERAHVQMDIGADEHPDEARITLTWPLPPLPASGHDPASAAHPESS